MASFQPRIVALLGVLILMQSAGFAAAQPIPMEAEVANLFKQWKRAWESSNSLLLDDLAAEGTDPFALLRTEDILDWPREAHVQNSDPERGPGALEFFQTTEAVGPLGELRRSSFQVKWTLKSEATGWKITGVTLLPAVSDALPPAISGGEADTTLERARRMLEEHQMDEAADHLDELLAKPLDTWETRSPLGPVRIRAQALFLRGRLEAAAGRPASAMKRWTEALEGSPRFPAASNALAAGFLSRGDLHQAIPHWKASLSHHAEQPGIRALLEVHERALLHFPDPLERALFLTAVTGDAEKTPARLLRLLAKEPRHVETRRRLAQAYLLRHDAETAHALLEEHEYFHPGDLETRYLLGRAALGRGRIEDALHWFREVWRESPGYRDVLTFLSEINASNGRYREAIGHLRAAVQLRPGDAMLHFKLGTYAQELGDPGAARGWFRTAAELGVPAAVREELRRHMKLSGH